MLIILNSLNENIVSLGGMLKIRGFILEKDEKDNIEDRMQEDTIKDITQSHLDHTYEKCQELMVEENQRAYKVA